VIAPLGQGFVVENRTGGGMLVGTTAAAKAVPDGYTFLVGLTGNMSVNPSLFAKLTYDPLVDFTPVAMLTNYPFFVVVNNDLPVKSITRSRATSKSCPSQTDVRSGYLRRALPDKKRTRGATAHGAARGALDRLCCRRTTV
jgi:tripartite-type tricarboxylate transporter receptor subunit TctC